MSRRQGTESGSWLTVLTTIAAAALMVTVRPEVARATITQGDFSIFGTLRTQWAGRWGEGSDSRSGPPPVTMGPAPIGSSGFPAARTGGSFDFNHWDLVEAKQVIDVRPDYHIVKNYNFLGRLDTILIKDADLFAIYRGWYDAFGDFKNRGIVEPFNDWENYTQRDKTAWYRRNDLREYYAQVNVTDELSFRIGKQEVIWTEADALSGTEVINPSDLRFHWIHFESPEDLRRNVRMVKMNYNFGDLWITANNVWEAFWIPGDFQGAGNGGPGIVISDTDRRQPYFVQAATAVYNPFGSSNFTNQEGQPTRSGSFIDDGAQDQLIMVNLGSPMLATPVAYFDFATPTRSNTPNNSLTHSEFGTRYSMLLPIGNGLQVSLIYEYLYRAQKTGVDPFGPPPPCVAAGTCMVLVGPTRPPGTPFNQGGGVWTTVNSGAPNAYYKTRPGGLPMAAVCAPQGPLPVSLPGGLLIGGLSSGVPNARCGQFALDINNEIERTNFFGLTGTYYDKDVTDVVFRYDFAYLPKTNYFGHGMVTATPVGPSKTITTAPGLDQGDWSDEFEGIIALDRPTYIPWLSKQHTFIVVQQTTRWLPGLHNHPLQSIVSAGGKFRTFQNIGFIALNNWLFDGRLTTLNVFAWDEDDNTGFFSSTNAWRYSQNILFDFNLQWYLGLSGRYTDPFIFSRDQRINEAEFRFVYEI